MNAGVGGVDPLNWYYDIPIVSKVYLTLSFITTAACALDLISPFSLYFNYKLIVTKGQVWRLFTNFFFFGLFTIDFLFHMYFMVRYCRLLEEGSFRGKTADLVFLLVFGATLMTAMAPFINIHFLGSSLTFMMVYIWSQRNQHIRVVFFFLPFPAPYLPWVLLGLSVLLGNSPTIDLMGISVGHLYFFLEDILPEVARIRKWRVRHFLPTPTTLKNICVTRAPAEETGAAEVAVGEVGEVGEAGEAGEAPDALLAAENAEREHAGLPPLNNDE